MPYRNVYEEKTQHRLMSKINGEEPEKDPKKIAEIYKRQMPTTEDIKDTAGKLNESEKRVRRARKANRGIRKSILD